LEDSLVALVIIVADCRNTAAVDRGVLPRAEFDRARNSLVRACARFGTVGPSGQLPTAGDEAVALENPDFYIVEDQYSNERRLIIEPLLEKVSAPWLETISSAIEPGSGWDVLLPFDGGVDLILSPGVVRVFGFRPAATAAELDALVAELQRIVRR
jgi:hypothetical protein